MQIHQGFEMPLSPHVWNELMKRKWYEAHRQRIKRAKPIVDTCSPVMKLPQLNFKVPNPPKVERCNMDSIQRQNKNQVLIDKLNSIHRSPSKSNTSATFHANKLSLYNEEHIPKDTYKSPGKSSFLQRWPRNLVDKEMLQPVELLKLKSDRECTYHKALQMMLDDRNQYSLKLSAIAKPINKTKISY